METTILIVEDEKEIGDLIKLYLNSEGFNAISFFNGFDALDYMENNRVDLVLLDIMLPEINGFEVCQRIRENSHIPIIMLTAKIEDSDKIHGLTMGADDYITKPFKPLELIARVKAQLRRYKTYNKNYVDSHLVFCNNIVIDNNKHMASINDIELNLTPLEFSILKTLCENKGNVLSAEYLFKNIWEEKYYTQANNTIMVHIRHLREKLENAGASSDIIKTIWGVGYTIE